MINYEQSANKEEQDAEEDVWEGSINQIKKEMKKLQKNLESTVERKFSSQD
jgi:hypothetical protein